MAKCGRCGCLTRAHAHLFAATFVKLTKPFKVLVIQAANNLSDERAEYLISDRLSFMHFLGLSLGDRVPDARRYGFS